MLRQNNGSRYGTRTQILVNFTYTQLVEERLFILSAFATVCVIICPYQGQVSLENSVTCEDTNNRPDLLSGSSISSLGPCWVWPAMGCLASVRVAHRVSGGSLTLFLSHAYLVGIIRFILRSVLSFAVYSTTVQERIGSSLSTIFACALSLFLSTRAERRGPEREWYLLL